jgi:hypothetical protein
MEKQPMSNNQYKSKYYNIDAYYESTAKKDGWKKEDFIWALKILESLPKEKLIELCQHPEIDIRFTYSTWDEVDEEQLVAVLISDVPPNTLLNVIKKVIIEKK